MSYLLQFYPIYKMCFNPGEHETYYTHHTFDLIEQNVGQREFTYNIEEEFLKLKEETIMYNIDPSIIYSSVSSLYLDLHSLNLG